jgi:osmotically-inducible protein OsmY
VSTWVNGVLIEAPAQLLHVVVKNGSVTLYGGVLNSADSAIAGMQANNAPGAFSLDSDLMIGGHWPGQ